jgi:hypothetical protein
MKKGIIFLPLLVGCILASGFLFSRYLDKQVEKYAEKIKEKNEQDETMPNVLWDREYECWLGPEFNGRQ